MRASNKQKWMFSEKATKAASNTRNNEPSTSTSKRSGGKARQQPNKQNDKNDPPLEVRVRKAAPPDPELLSKIGCRCLVIDLPGVFHENLEVDYVRGFVRVEGKRTIGRIKSFRKKFSLNHEQVVTRMLSAFFCQGVLVIVAPTKIAASMAVAAMVANQILMKGHYNPQPSETKPRLLLMPDPASNTLSEGPVKFTNDLRATAAASTSEVIDCRPSAFEPYVSSRPLPYDEPLDLEENETHSMPSRFSTEVKNMACALGKHSDHLPNQMKHESAPSEDRKLAIQVEKSLPSVGHSATISDSLTHESCPATLENNNPAALRLQEYMKEADKYVQSPITRGTESSTSSYGEPDHPVVVWSDDSLRDEPSVSKTNSRKILEACYLDSFRDERVLSPILEHHSADDKVCWQISPDTPQSSDRPLKWVQFDASWQDKEESLMVDTAENHSRVEQLRHGRRRVEGTTATIGVPIMLPFEEELMNREDQATRPGFEPNPYWRSAPFLPRFSSPPSNSHLTTIDGPFRTEYRGLALPFRRTDQAPSPSLRRKAASPPKKSVTWMDEI